MRAMAQIFWCPRVIAIPDELPKGLTGNILKREIMANALE